MSSPSSSTDLIAQMKLAEKYLYQVGCPILMAVGTVGSILNLIVFTQKNLRKNPCSIYFIAYNLANFVFIYSSLLSSTLAVGYNIDPSAYNLVICRLRIYTFIVFNCLSPFYLILASIDRILVTSPNALTRRRSTRRFAYTCIIIGTLFWVLFHTHALIVTIIIQPGPTYFLCYTQQDAYLTFLSYYSITKEILALSLMTICGLWSIMNIKRMHRVRVAPNLPANRAAAESSLHSTFSKDRQLILMLLTDITISALFSFLFAIFLTYQQITQDYVRTPEKLQADDIIRNVCLFSIGIPFCISCYTNLIVSKTFRNEMKKVLVWQRLFCTH